MTTHTEKAAWAAMRMLMRSDLTEILRSIENGSVTDVDFATLNNFCMVALALLSKIEKKTWDAAFRQAEISALLRNEVEDLPE